MDVDVRVAVVTASHRLASTGLATGTFGNVSGVDRDRGIVGIKPSGLACADLEVADVSVVRIDTGEHLGGLRPSSDTPAHLELYRTLHTIGGVADCHSTWATIWAQAVRPIPCLGTTHADMALGEVPVTRVPGAADLDDDYEHRTGALILEALAGRDPGDVPAVLVAQHGVFAWGDDPTAAAATLEAVEQVALLAYHTVQLAPEARPIGEALHRKHYFRKHGDAAYYGQ